jgi:hypothetical protein
LSERGREENRRSRMLSTLYHERLVTTDSENTSKGVRARIGSYGLDEIALFALVAVAVIYIAVASCLFVY